MNDAKAILVRVGEKELAILNRISRTEQISRQEVIRRLINKEGEK